MISRVSVEFEDYFRDMQEYNRLKNMVESTTLDPQKKVESTSWLCELLTFILQGVTFNEQG